ncbi:BORG1 protein, partial [Brachypteracias leptosomus]|nr:BORG1 protein [Brachypteracias leptosomus]
MSTKVPIYLKRGSRKGKKEKLRDILSSDMISPPLGDFRHTIHIGSGGHGDTFGDISFLQGKFHLLPRARGQESPEEAPFEFSRTATVSGREQPPGASSCSPLLKNAISLPLIGGPQALTLPPAQAPPKPPRLHLDEKVPRGWGGEEEEDGEGGSTEATTPAKGPPTSSSPLTPPTNGLAEEKGGAEPTFLSHAGSLLSLHVDLGPSILEDVLQVMEKHQAGQDTGRQEVWT